MIYPILAIVMLVALVTYFGGTWLADRQEKRKERRKQKMLDYLLDFKS